MNEKTEGKRNAWWGPILLSDGSLFFIGFTVLMTSAFIGFELAKHFLPRGNVIAFEFSSLVVVGITMLILNSGFWFAVRRSIEGKSRPSGSDSK